MFVQPRNLIFLVAPGVKVIGNSEKRVCGWVTNGAKTPGNGSNAAAWEEGSLFLGRLNPVMERVDGQYR